MLYALFSQQAIFILDWIASHLHTTIIPTAETVTNLGANVTPLKQTLQVPALHNLDRARLDKWLVDDSEAEASKFGADGHGDLGLTTAIVIVSLAAIRALAPILVRNKRRQIIRKTDTYVDSGGITHTTETELIIEAEWSEAEVIAAIGKATGVDLTPLLGSS